jgi:hypothetical protein
MSSISNGPTAGVEPLTVSVTHGLITRGERKEASTHIAEEGVNFKDLLCQHWPES